MNALPDGYTLLLASVEGAVNATLYERLNCNFIRDIAAVAGIIRAPSRYSCESLVSRQNGSRVHRLCKSEHGRAPGRVPSSGGGGSGGAG